MLFVLFCLMSMLLPRIMIIICQCLVPCYAAFAVPVWACTSKAGLQMVGYVGINIMAG